ncbi:MAG: hypothetical protein ACYTHJ_00975 [Planctomycetota bacterium]|jgi:hypothetical protein
MTSFRPQAAATLATSFLVFAGCLQREEKIHVASDGRVDISINYRGSEDDFRTLKTRPLGGTIEKDGDDFVLQARKSFAAGETLPHTYAEERDPDGDLQLRFPTTVEMEDRSDGTYYILKRTYESRPWNQVKYWEDRFLKTKEITELSEKEESTLTDEERFQIIRAFAQAEARRQLVFADEAAKEAAIDLPLDHLLQARQALLDEFDDVSIRNILNDCQPMPEDQRDECVSERAESFLEGTIDAFISQLTVSVPLGIKQATGFRKAYDRAALRHKITNDTGGHKFDIVATLPGEVVGHNAEEITVSADGGTTGFHWTFGGAAYRDRPHVLVAITRVPHDEARE